MFCLRAPLCFTRHGWAGNAVLEVTLLNNEHGFKFEEYGASITVRRTIKQPSGGGFELLDHDRTVGQQSRCREIFFTVFWLGLRTTLGTSVELLEPSLSMHIAVDCCRLLFSYFTYVRGLEAQFFYSSVRHACNGFLPSFLPSLLSSFGSMLGWK